MYRRFTSLMAIGALAMLGTPARAQTPVPELARADLETWLDNFVPAALRRADIAGLVVSVVKDGQVLIAKGYGYADLAARVPMDAERTVLRVASVSKTFTATAVMQLVEQGTLDLDRDVNEYLDFTIPPAFGKPITLRHLLTHTAGFEETAYKRYNPPATLREYVLRIPDRIYPPGTVPAYSNYGLSLAGYIVARVSGESITDYIERHILTPLGMQRSSFRMTLPEALEPSLARTYALASSATPFPPSLVAELTPAEAPASALATTGLDMTRFMLAHLQEGRYGDVQLLRPETLRRMQAPSFVPMPGAQPIALGLFRADYKGHRVIGHSGDGEGAHAEMKLLPDENVGLFLAVNSDGLVDTFLPAAFTLRAELFEQFVDRYFPAPAAPEEPTAVTAREHARLVAGEYAWSRQQKGDFQEAIGLIGRFALKAVIRANADGTIETPASLTFEKNGRSQTWREVGPFVWREVGGNARLLISVRDGKVQSLWTDQSASFWVDLPVPALLSAWLNVPLLLLATGALVLTMLLWPVEAFVRRRGQARPDERSYRLTRIAVLLGLLYMLGWALALRADLASKVGADPWIRLIQLIGLLTVVGAVIAARNVWLTWRSRASVWTKIGDLVPALALVYLSWFSFAFHLISVRLN
jgi:CubicO group peptidase (beta-lactamase class C family)